MSRVHKTIGGGVIVDAPIEPEYNGVAVTGAAAEPDDPQPVLTTNNAINMMEYHTQAITQLLRERGVHQLQVEVSESQIRRAWRFALWTVR